MKNGSSEIADSLFNLSKVIKSDTPIVECIRVAWLQFNCPVEISQRFIVLLEPNVSSTAITIGTGIGWIFCDSLAGLSDHLSNRLGFGLCRRRAVNLGQNIM